LAATPARQNWSGARVASLRQELKLAGGVRIELAKAQFPWDGGWAAASSDAAAALAGLLRLFERRIEQPRLLEIAAGLGAMCRFSYLAGAPWRRPRR